MYDSFIYPGCDFDRVATNPLHVLRKMNLNIQFDDGEIITGLIGVFGFSQSIWIPQFKPKNILFFQNGNTQGRNDDEKPRQSYSKKQTIVFN